MTNNFLWFLYQVWYMNFMKKRRKLHNQNHILASNFDERENQLRHPHFPSLCNRAIFNKFSFKMLPGLSIYLVSLAPSGLLLPSVMYEVVTRGLTEPIDFCQQSRYSHCRLLSYPSLCNFAMFPYILKRIISITGTNDMSLESHYVYGTIY